MALIMQIVMIWNLGKEVFEKEITPSGSFMTLRFVLVVFLAYLFDAEQSSIRKTKLFVLAKKVGAFMQLTNILREGLSYCLLGTALWQIFSINPDEAEVVDEIMNFAALLIVIELDDFLMASPNQMWCKQYYGDKYLDATFDRKEIQDIAYKGLPIKQKKSDEEDVS